MFVRFLAKPSADMKDTIESARSMHAGWGRDGMHGEYKIPGGKLVVVDLGEVDGRLVDVSVSGDFFIEPDSALDVINAALDGLATDTSQAHLAMAIETALGEEVSLYGITAEGVAVAVRRAINAGAQA